MARQDRDHLGVRHHRRAVGGLWQRADGRRLRPAGDGNDEAMKLEDLSKAEIARHRRRS